MELNVQGGEVLELHASLAALGVVEGDPLPDAVANLLEPSDFRGKGQADAVALPTWYLAPRRLLLIGLGAREVNAEIVREVSAPAVKQARDLQVDELVIGVNGDLPLISRRNSTGLCRGNRPRRIQLLALSHRTL